MSLYGKQGCPIQRCAGQGPLALDGLSAERIKDRLCTLSNRGHFSGAECNQKICRRTEENSGGSGDQTERWSPVSRQVRKPCAGRTTDGACDRFRSAPIEGRWRALICFDRSLKRIISTCQTLAPPITPAGLFLRNKRQFIPLGCVSE